MNPPSLILAYAAFCVLSTGAMASEGAAGPDQVVCATSAIMAADPPGVGELGSWSVVSGSAVFADDQDPQTLVTGLSPGENILLWSLFIGGPPQTDLVSITVYDPAATVAFAGPDSTLCLPTDEMVLMATPATFPAIGSWASVGIALIDVVTDPHSTATFPAVGSVQMIWTVYNGSCGQTSDTALITVDDCVIGIMDAASLSPDLLFDAATRSLRNVGPLPVLADVLDQSGRAVLARRSVPPGGRFSITELPAGVYTARSIADGRPRTIRFLLQP